MACPDLGKVVSERVQDLVGGLGPAERPGVGVPGGDPVPDVVFQGLDGGVDAAADQLVGEQAEPALDLVHPGGAGGGEVHVEPGAPGQPGPDLGGVVGGVDVADQVHVQVGGHGFVDGDQELAELDRPVAAVQFADDGAVGDVERGEQAGDAVPVVVVGAPFGHAGH